MTRTLKIWTALSLILIWVSEGCALQKVNRASVEMQNNMPVFMLNGKPTPPIMFFFNSAMNEGQDNLRPQVRKAAQAGIHIYTMLLGDWPWADSKGEYAHGQDWSIPDGALARYVASDPNALFVPRIWGDNPENLINEKDILQEDLVVFGDGHKTRSASIASERFWKLYIDNNVRFVKRYEAGEYGPRIIGYHFGANENLEWFNREYRSKGPDYSAVNVKAFRKWLRNKYCTDAALAKAWGIKGLAIDAAKIPAWDPNRFPMHGVPAGQCVQIFYDIPTQQHWIDYSCYANELVANRIMDAANAIKRACGRKKLTLTFYGYVYETCGSFGGHLAAGKVLRCPDIDMLASPIAYIEGKDRLAGGPSGAMAAVDSVALHGKIWMNEDDMRTHLVDRKRQLPPWLPDVQFGKQTQSMQETLSCIDRNLGYACVHRSGTWLMDLIAAGAFNHDLVWNVVGNRNKIYADMYQSPCAYTPDIGLIVDEISSRYVYNDWDVFIRTLPMLRNECMKTGAQVGFYYLQDFIEGISPPCKVYVFANTYKISDEDIVAIHSRLKKENATAVWQYAPGIVGDTGLDTSRSSKLTGVQLERLDGRMGSVGSNALSGHTWGWNNGHHISPRLVVRDSNAAVLGHYLSDKEVSAASKEVNGFRSVVFCDFELSRDILQKIFKQADVHIWANNGQIINTDKRWLIMHAADKSELKVNLPQNRGLHQLWDYSDILQGADLGNGVTQWYELSAQGL